MSKSHPFSIFHTLHLVLLQLVADVEDLAHRVLEVSRLLLGLQDQSNKLVTIGFLLQLSGLIETILSPVELGLIWLIKARPD